MTIASRIAGWALKLPPASTRDVAVERDLSVKMPDGVVLMADRFYPLGGHKPPTILVRSPYGRRGVLAFQYGRLYAERGFQVILQSVRGTFGSGGTLDPFGDERDDGLATVRWIQSQDWYSGELAMLGPSYLGFVQWSVASEVGPDLKAMAAQITASEFRSQTYDGNSFSLSTAITWLFLVHNQEDSPLSVLAMMMGRSRNVTDALMHLPVKTADEVTTGKPVPYFREWLKHNQPGDPYWTRRDHTKGVSSVSAPVNLLSGWYDIFLPWQLKDYEVLRKSGRNPYLLIGPWSHSQPAVTVAATRESLSWFKAHLLGDRRFLREKPVRIFVMGSNQWREFSEWPPAAAQMQRWHLQPAHGLAKERPGESEPDRYRYDPADPTPAFGGAVLGNEAGVRDNTTLEARADVLTYTTGALEQDLEVIGPVRAVLFVSSSLGHADFFARVCDVNSAGKSMNLCDGLLRVVPDLPVRDADGVMRIEIELWPTANCFRRGHKIRVQVSSGAHPRYVRNLGTDDALGEGTSMLAADQRVYHEPARASFIELSVLE